MLGLKENPGYFFSVVQVGINGVAILGGVVGEAVFTDAFAVLLSPLLSPELLTPVSFFCSFLLVTVLFVMFADLIPKRVAMSCPEKVAVRCIRPMVTLIALLKPLVWLLTALANAIMRMMRVPLKNQDQITNEDVIATVEAGAKAGVIAPLEHTAITNMMGLENHLVPSAMTARDSIIYFSLDESDESIREKISMTPHNKFLVVDGDIDHVAGVVDGKQLLKLYADGEALTIRRPGIVQPIITIPDSLTLTETLDLFKKESSDFAVVINEYGLTVGIITLKDILWPVMGNYDVWADDQLLVERADGTWLVDGSTPGRRHRARVRHRKHARRGDLRNGRGLHHVHAAPRAQARGLCRLCGLAVRGHQHGRLSHRSGAPAPRGPSRQACRQDRKVGKVGQVGKAGAAA